MSGKRILGIDLGTTYCCVAHVDEAGKPVILTNMEDSLTTPSVIHFESEDNVIVGKLAMNAAVLDPDRVVSLVKRHMGDPDFFFEVDGREYRPEELSSFLLRKLTQDAAEAVGCEISDVVITCPAYFGINEREATKKAGELAGLNVCHVLNEPTAAAICYGLLQTEDQVVLVYDFGGGTFDVTMIAVHGGSTQVVFTDGDHSLGGRDIDERLVNYLADQFLSEKPEAGDPRDDPYSLQALTNAAEEAKKGLSTRHTWPLTVDHSGQRVRVVLTRDMLCELCGDLLDRTVDLVLRVVEQGKKRGHEHLDHVLLVGGSSKIPTLGQRLERATGIEPQLFEPDLAVAKGAALMGLHLMADDMVRDEVATQLGGDKDDLDLSNIDRVTLEEAAQRASEKAGPSLRLPSSDLADMATSTIVNVCSKGFGVVVLDGETMTKEVQYLIHNNTSVPAEVTETGFGTVERGQPSVHLEVMEQAGQAESPEVDNNTRVAEGEIMGLPGDLPAGSPIHVTFRLEEDGTLRVSALEPRSGQDLQLEVEVEGVMSTKEVEERRGLLLKKSVS